MRALAVLAFAGVLACLALHVAAFVETRLADDETIYGVLQIAWLVVFVPFLLILRARRAFHATSLSDAIYPQRRARILAYVFVAYAALHGALWVISGPRGVPSHDAGGYTVLQGRRGRRVQRITESEYRDLRPKYVQHTTAIMMFLYALPGIFFSFAGEPPAGRRRS